MTTISLMSVEDQIRRTRALARSSPTAKHVAALGRAIMRREHPDSSAIVEPRPAHQWDSGHSPSLLTPEWSDVPAASTRSFDVVPFSNDEVFMLAGQLESVVDAKHHALIHRLRLAAETLGALQSIAAFDSPR